MSALRHRKGYVPGRPRTIGRRLRLSTLIVCVSVVGMLAVSCTAAPGSDQAHAGHSSTGSTHSEAPTQAPQDCDTQFLLAMIPHHEQAVLMSELAQDRASDSRVASLAAGIIRMQRVEIAMMNDWVETEGLPVDGDHAPHVEGHDQMPGMSAMPGMLTQAEIDALKAATGASFDAMFLEKMIQHHRGALTMVEQMLDAGASSGVRSLAVDTATEQRYEILAMWQLQIELLTGQRPSQASMAQRAAAEPYDDPLPADGPRCGTS